MEKIESLKALYEGQLGTLKLLSERSFSTTLQALTLNIVVVAGLIGGKVMLLTAGKVIGTLLLIAFNGLIIFYLISKSLAHHREKQKLITIQRSLATIGEVQSVINNTEPCFWKSFIGGSLIFILAVLSAGVCTIVAMWMSLVAPQGPVLDNSKELLLRLNSIQKNIVQVEHVLSEKLNHHDLAISFDLSSSINTLDNHLDRHLKIIKSNIKTNK